MYVCMYVARVTRVGWAFVGRVFSPAGFGEVSEGFGFGALDSLVTANFPQVVRMKLAFPVHSSSEVVNGVLRWLPLQRVCSRKLRPPSL